ncbi:MAG: sigma-54-dependent Fis family transcriptional regulator [Planctomycetes bacterium]|nr:sigma-54-dependent Fis family transcriptional regulator [Planctomycetota bacterium]
MTHRIAVVEDQDLVRDSLVDTLTRAGWAVEAHAQPEEALAAFRQRPTDLVITDLRMPGMNGVELLAEVRRIAPEVPVIVITAYGSVENAVEAMRRGAYDYLTKPFRADAIELVVRKALETRELRAENRFLKGELRASQAFEFVSGGSPAMARVQETIRKVAASAATVLVTGESGTGKEVVARALHFWGDRAERPFLSVNCAALSAGLLESELFGHERGAFTGAERVRKGRFELAHGGTLLLDEVSEIDLDLQSKLLRVLQEKSFERVGSNETLRVDVRVVATSNRDLAEAVRQHRFREDLYYRLNVIRVEIPPLRERPEDIGPLARHFVGRFSAREGRPEMSIEPEVFHRLRNYRWPGNVRELENVIERACLLFAGPVLLPEHVAPGLREDLPVATQEAIGHRLAGMSIEEMEKVLIKDTLDRFDGHQVRSAEALGIGVRTLRTKIKKWRLR